MTKSQLISLSVGKDGNISSKIRNKTKMSTLATFIQRGIGSSSHKNQRRKIYNRNPNWKRRIKTVTLCRWHDSVYRNPKNSTIILLGQINEFSKFSGYKISIKNYVVFLYTNNKVSQRKLRKVYHLKLYQASFLTTTLWD